MTLRRRSSTALADDTRVRTPQSERVEATRRKIIDAALALLREEGFKAATLQAIARRAEVSLGALQHHFESRDVLMERLVAEVMAPLGDQGGVWPDRALPLDERAGQFVERAWNGIFGAPNYQTAWSLFFGCKAIPALFERIEGYRRHVDQGFYAQFFAVFPELQDHPHPQGVASVVFSALRGAAVQELFTVDAQEKHGSLAVLAEFIAGACRRAPTA
ncbi:TetR/AcrR family transcriptional regulator [Pseudorhodoferax sp.]|uniref:TetR/AcrR family transcriptional regulator n=1 Tax=Pseudorhodoferax sp. TaxID=1993553 RepID=UPI0039E594DA